jgi:hypothetical protein
MTADCYVDYGCVYVIPTSSTYMTADYIAGYRYLYVIPQVLNKWLLFAM